MSRPTNNRISRAPSPPPPPPPPPRPVRHSSLTIRTMNQQPQPSVPNTPTSPPPRAYPVYPIPIPPEKLPKALQLYRTYCLAETLAQSQAEPQSATGYDGFHLDVPGRAQSITSRTSSRPRAASITTSTYDAVTDLSSVVSFDENESPSSAKARAQGELLSFDGKVVKQRARKRLSPTAKAKAALIRYLGSCWVCRSRRVPCPFEHHDIDCLERIVREAQARPQLAPPQPHRQSYSSNSSSSQLTAKSISGNHQPAAAGGSQTDTLFGVGGNEQLLDDLASFDADLDIQLPGGGPYSDIQLELPAPAPPYAAAPEPQAFNSYPLYQDSGMLKLGVQNGEYFYCQYVRHQVLGGLCNELCIDGEQLQAHFEQQHGSFTRIEEPYRAICSFCESLNSYAVGVCSRCGRNGLIQVWVCGSSIRPVSYQGQAPDGMDYQPFSSSSAPYNPSYGMSNMDTQWGAPGADQGNYNGGTFGYGNGFQGGNNYGAYGGPGNQGYDYNPPNESHPGGNQFQGHNFRTASQIVQKGPVTVRILFSTAKERWQRQKLVLFFLILLVAITFGFTHDWIFSKLRTAGPKAAAEIRSHLPVMGLGVVMASFGVCLSVKQLATRRVRRAQCRPRSCPLHALANTSLPFECAYVMGGAYS